MGEVYRARDLKLGREVAIKIIPPQFTSDRERLARFEREARLLATLNHPNIAAIYGFEDPAALILELVEGQSLAQRLAGLRDSGFGMEIRSRSRGRSPMRSRPRTRKELFIAT